MCKYIKHLLKLVEVKWEVMIICVVHNFIHLRMDVGLCMYRYSTYVNGQESHSPPPPPLQNPGLED